jgi:hypothetical protein
MQGHMSLRSDQSQNRAIDTKYVFKLFPSRRALIPIGFEDIFNSNSVDFTSRATIVLLKSDRY